MCGRYALNVVPSTISAAQRRYFEALELYGSSFNVAPTDLMPICRLSKDREPELTTARWGLIPYWAKDAKIGYSTINARSETVATKPVFREAYKRRRCLVPASGYFEWAKTPYGKQPYYFTSADGSMLAFAGLWERWKPKEGEPITSFTIVVCAPNPLAAGIHDRMPVLLPLESWERWLNEPDPAKLLIPCRNDLLKVYPVSTLVNRPENNEPALLDPLPSAG